jgi:hypothetical protein
MSPKSLDSAARQGYGTGGPFDPGGANPEEDGYSNVTALAGGLKAWKEQALPLEAGQE